MCQVQWKWFDCQIYEIIFLHLAQSFSCTSMMAQIKLQLSSWPLYSPCCTICSYNKIIFVLTSFLLPVNNFLYCQSVTTLNPSQYRRDSKENVMVFLSWPCSSLKKKSLVSTNVPTLMHMFCLLYLWNIHFCKCHDLQHRWH